ncbi:hypothetical protein [Lysobacter gummosus]
MEIGSRESRARVDTPEPLGSSQARAAWRGLICVGANARGGPVRAEPHNA